MASGAIGKSFAGVVSGRRRRHSSFGFRSILRATLFMFFGMVLAFCQTP
jgi:hypothetical protein